MGGNLTYTNATTSNRLTALSGASTRSFGFDANGNRISDSSGNVTFHYDPFNRMDSSTKRGVNTSYHVNALGQRDFKWSSPTQTGYFVYAPGPTPANASGHGKRCYSHKEIGPVCAEIDSTIVWKKILDFGLEMGRR